MSRLEAVKVESYNHPLLGHRRNIFNPLKELDDNTIDNSSDKVYVDSNCGICLEEYANEEDKMLGRCGHVLHKFCYQKWSEIKRECPTCRGRFD